VRISMKAYYLAKMLWSPGLPRSEYATQHGLAASALKII
jgi:hypothetical protein